MGRAVMLMAWGGGVGLTIACSEPRAPAQPPPPSQKAAHEEPAVRSPDPMAVSSEESRSASPEVASPTASTATKPRVAPDWSSGEPTDDGPHLTSVRFQTWIWEHPIKGGKYLGYMRVGQRLRLKREDKVKGQGCPRGFYAVEPLGYVCDDLTVTRASVTPFLVANAATAPLTGAFPYRWAISSGAPMYARLPSAKEQERHERWQFGPAGQHPPLPQTQRSHEHLATTHPIEARDPVPRFLAVGRGARGPVLRVKRRNIPRGAMFSFTKAFEHEGRTFLLSSDLTVVPADRVRAFRQSEFEGVVLDADHRLPRAWFRRSDRTRFARTQDGFRAMSAPFSVRTSVGLTGQKETLNDNLYLETDDGTWVRQADATVVEARTKRPFGVPAGAKWLIISIGQGTLVAYEDMTPVFTTLISPGKGGQPRRGGDPIQDSTTPLGSYKITFKDRAATMAPEFGENRSFWIADVPFTMYFHAPFALHGAYWHERFGEPISQGCVNLSPRDAARLFEWTDPAVPPGWQGIMGHALRESGGPDATWVVVTR